MWSVRHEKIRQKPWFTHLLTDQPWFALPTETCNCLHVSTLFCTKIRFCCCNAHNHDPRISSSQTHGFNSLWKMSSETHVIQKNSPHSIVPLKSNDKRADPLCPLPPLLAHVGPSHRKAALTQLRSLECRVVAPTRHPSS